MKERLILHDTPKLHRWAFIVQLLAVVYYLYAFVYYNYFIGFFPPVILALYLTPTRVWITPHWLRYITSFNFGFYTYDRIVSYKLSSGLAGKVKLEVHLIKGRRTRKAKVNIANDEQINELKQFFAAQGIEGTDERSEVLLEKHRARIDPETYMLKDEERKAIYSRLGLPLPKDDSN